jgi:hypothetical protein
MAVGPKWLLLGYIVLVSVSLASFTFIARLDVEQEIFTLVGKPVVVHCPFQSTNGYIWEISGSNYSLAQLPEKFNPVKDERQCYSSLNFTATKELNGTTFRCWNSDKTQGSNISVLRVQGCVVDLQPAHMPDSESVELDWESGCEQSRSIDHIEVECSSAEEYRRIRLPHQLKRTTLMGLMPWTHFELRVGVMDEQGTLWKSKPMKLMTRKAGIPSAPQFLSLSAISVLHDDEDEGRHMHSGVEVLFSACDRGHILHYTIEVAMDANFSDIIENGTVYVDNASRKAEIDGLQDNTTYWMRMKAVGHGGDSMYSAAQSVNTLEVASDPDESMTVVIEEMKSNGLLVSTIVLAILFVISGLVALYICLYLRQ